ncbi:hypothetical protein AeNC1_001386 [Aphanomyces euteiches]|nr:hypothetical protein AeNC1_001386 [Aphanomyces euteiches]
MSRELQAAIATATATATATVVATADGLQVLLTANPCSYTQSNIAGYVANLGPYLDFMLERDQLAFEADSKEEYFMSPIPFNQGGSGGGGDGLLDEDILLHTSLISPSNSDGSSGSNN